MSLHDVRRAAQAFERADQERRKARAMLRDACRAALGEEVPISRVAQEAHMGRGEVENVVAGR